MSHRALLTLCDGCLILEHLVWILRGMTCGRHLQAGLSTCSFLIIPIILALSPPIYQDHCVGAVPDLGPGTNPHWSCLRRRLVDAAALAKGHCLGRMHAPEPPMEINGPA